MLAQMRFVIQTLVLPVLFLVTVAARAHADDLIHPGDVWLDDRGKPIQAHGGGVIKVGDRWFWFGEDRSRENDPALRYVSCYSSPDLIHWTFRNQSLKLGDPDQLGPHWVLERPKVYPIAKTGKFVMYMHIDGQLPGVKSNYAAARVGIAVSDTVDGDYKFIRSFRPFGKESRDIGQFIDDDGSNYLIFESRPTKGFFIDKLSDDGLDPAEETCFIKAPLEGGGLIHIDDTYYVIGSHLSGWSPNSNVYATAKSIKGPWSEFKDVAPPQEKTYGGQSTMLLSVVGTQKTRVIFLADRWEPRTLWDSRYLWLPVDLSDGKFVVKPPKPWGIDVHTGVVTTVDPVERGTSRPAPAGG